MDTTEDRTATSAPTLSDDEREATPEDDTSEPSRSAEAKKTTRGRNSLKTNGHLSAHQNEDDDQLNKFEFSVEVAMLEIYNESVIILV